MGRAKSYGIPGFDQRKAYMKSPIVYFDTSVFIGLLDNVEGRQPTARNIIRYESDCQSQIHTSIMTVNEFISRTFDTYHDQVTLTDKVQEVIQSIRNIAQIQGFNESVATEAARMLSIWGRVRLTNPLLPRDKKFRWDSIHLATANLIKAERVYAWDDTWNDFPVDEIKGIGKIISPAVAPQTDEQPPLFNEEA